MDVTSPKDEYAVWSSANLDMHIFTQRFKAQEATYETKDELWFYLCIEGGGRIVRKSAFKQMDGLFLPGMVGIEAPQDRGEGFWPDTKLIGLGLEPSRLASLLDELPPGSFDVEAVASTLHRNTLLAEIIRAMWADAGLHARSTAFLDHGAALALHQLAKSRNARGRSHDRPLASFELKAIKDFVEANIAEDVSVETLARIVGMSQYHFIRRFRAATGLAPYQFLTQRRLDRAAEFLVATRLPVTQVGLLSGYANPSYFTAAFRRYKGVTPLAWRRTR